MINISNEQMDVCFKDEVNQKFMNKAGKPYKKFFTKSEFNQIKLMAVWRALVKYDDSKGQKFTSSLYRHMIWQCRQKLQELNKNNRKPNTYTINYGIVSKDNIEDKMEYEFSVESLNEQERSLFEDLHLYKKKNRTICKEDGITEVELKKRILNLEEKLQWLRK